MVLYPILSELPAATANWSVDIHNASVLMSEGKLGFALFLPIRLFIMILPTQ